MVSAVVAGREASMRIGSLRNCLVSRVISGGMVAEKNRVCFLTGVSLKMRSRSGMKPMSSMRSASSTTMICTPVISSLPRSKWSSRRPGVAISTSTPRSSFSSWSAKETPPISSAQESFWPLAYVSKDGGDLVGQFAGRRDDQGARHARLGAAGLQPVDHRQGEGGGLAGAGLGDAQHVPAGRATGMASAWMGVAVV